MKKIFFFCLIFISSHLQAQRFGGNPPSVKWMQVNSEAARVIFPSGLDSQAQRIANIINGYNTASHQTIGDKQKKIDIVLQNTTTISNAYVALGPRRSEFFLTPLQNSFDIGSLPWPDQLAIHEYRHVQQYNNFDVGLSRLLHVLFGEEGQALANGAAIPNWLFEGDAVYNETNTSKQGRGRLPYFFKDYRSLWQANKNYSWMKLRNGSYKDFIPDHYALGYLMIAYGREKYGDDFWKNVTHDAAAYKGFFYPLQNAIKKYSGKNYVAFRNDALNYFKKELNAENPVASNPTSNAAYKNEEYPAFINDSTIVFVKSSYKHIPAFVIRKGFEEKKIRTKNVSLDNYFSYRNGKIVYSSYRSDIRWSYKDYSNIEILDVRTGKQKTLTKRAKLFAPDINDDGSKVVAVNVAPGGKSNLQILNASDGKVITTVPNPAKLFYTYPKFYTDVEIVSPVRNPAGQMALAMINTATGNTSYLTPFSYNAIGFPSLARDTIYFTASQQKEDKLFAYILSTQKIFQLGIAGDGIGYYQPSAINKKIAWTTFTADGYRLQESNVNSIQWKTITTGEFIQPLSNFDVPSVDKTNANLLSKVPNKTLEVSRYSKFTGLFNFHSIEPTVDDPEYALTLIGENVLNTMQSQLSFSYNRSEKWKRVGLNEVYGGLFPYLSAGVNYTIDRRGRYHNKIVYWNELEPYAGINFPLNLSKGRSTTTLNFGTSFVYNQTNFQGTYKDTFGTLSYSYLSNFLTFTNQIQRAKQNIFPRLAQTLTLRYKDALGNHGDWQFLANGYLYLPGLLTNHNIVLNGAYQRDTLFSINFSSGFPFSRGYASENLHEMFKWGVNYHLPLFYPDAGFANIIYLLRARANLFYDFTHVNDHYSNGTPFRVDFRSAGAELYFDTKWWNEYAVTFGIRYSYLLDPDVFGGAGRNRWELILPVNLLHQ